MEISTKWLPNRFLDFVRKGRRAPNTNFKQLFMTRAYIRNIFQLKLSSLVSCTAHRADFRGPAASCREFRRKLRGREKRKYVLGAKI